MKLISVFILLISLVACNKEKKTYIYELTELSEDNFIVDKNAKCEENKYDSDFRKKYCVTEGKFTTCIKEDQNIKFKEFTTKSVCDAEISVKKKENLSLDS
jgi:hypothetical protein